MKRLLYILLPVLLLVSCADSSAIKTNPEGRREISGQVSETGTALNGDAGTDRLEAASIRFEDLNTGATAGYADEKFIMEFLSFIFNQTYSTSQTKLDKSYTASLLDSKGGIVLEIALGSRSAVFDRNIRIRGFLYEKGKIYETAQWLDEYLRNFAGGIVLNPALISFPARLRTPGEFLTVDMLNRGNTAINKYETLVDMNDFIKNSFAGREFEITGGERLYGGEAVLTEEERQGRSRVLRVFTSGDSFINIISSSKYNELVGADSISLYRSDDTPDTYRLAADGEVLFIQVSKAFDKLFQQLFDNDAKTRVKLTAPEIEKLFEQKKPWFTDFICKNLGMDIWNHRGDDVLKRSELKLADGKQYTVLNITNPYDTRLLFFNIKTGAFIDYIDFGGRQAGTAYKTERAGGNVWIVGNRCRGHGTGEDINNTEWYTLDEGGKKLALSIPDNAYSVGPYGGSAFEADKIMLIDGSPVKLKVDYDVTRVYMLDVKEADEYGQVKIKIKKAVEFKWDAGLGRFTSSYAVENNGLTCITPDSPEITDKCGTILEKNFDSLKSEIEALVSNDNDWERSRKARSLEEFLRDCPDSGRKAVLLKLLSDKNILSGN